LVELLVVVAIIALLVSILLPTLGKAKEQARIVICLTNLKGLSTAFAYYGTENDGWYPKGAPWGNGNDTWETILQPYYQNYGLVHCSGDKAVRNWEQGWSTSLIPEENRYPRSYAINGKVSSLGASETGEANNCYDNPDFPWPGYVHNENEIPVLSETILVGEQWTSRYSVNYDYFPGTYSVWWGYGIFQDTAPCDHAATDDVHRNNDAANYLFCDGHALLLPATDPNLTNESEYYYWHWER